jgi:hypothetical protein
MVTLLLAVVSSDTHKGVGEISSVLELYIVSSGKELTPFAELLLLH